MSRVVESKIQFDKWAETYGLTKADRDEAWSAMVKSGMDPSDPNSYFLIATTVVQRLLRLMEDANAAMPARIEAAARKAVGPVTEAATKQVEAAHAALTASTGKELANVAAGVFRETAVTRAYQVKFALWSSALVALAFCILTGFWIGQGVGRSSAESTDLTVRSLAARGDIVTVLRVLQHNPNLRSAIGTNCITGTGNQVVAGGARSCRVPLWLDEPPPAGVASVGAAPHYVRSLTTFWMSGAEWLNRFYPTTILAMGLGLGLLIPFVSRFVRRRRA